MPVRKLDQKPAQWRTSSSSKLAHLVALSILATLLVLPPLVGKICEALEKTSESNWRGQHQGEQQMKRRSYGIDKDFAPKLIHQPQSAHVQPNQPHTVECAVEAQPEAEVRWFKDERILASRPPHLDLTGAELMFVQMNDDDTGDYYCQASNYLGSVTSERFTLTVQSSVHDASIRLEPRLAEVGPEERAEFTCTIPALRRERPAAASKAPKEQQRSPPDVSWRRNGRRLSVNWLARADSDESPEAATRGQARGGQEARYLARQVAREQFVLTLTRPIAKEDDNATFTCLYLATNEAGSGEDSGEDSGEMPRESSPVRLRLRDGPDASGAVKLDVNLAPPIEGLVDSHDPAQVYERTGKNNHTTQLLEPPPGGASIRRVSTLKQTLEDLFELVKPTLLVFLLVSCVSVVIVLQLIYIRRRSRQNRYMKHHQYSSGSGASSSGTSSIGGGLAGPDPVLSSLMGRTLSMAPSCQTVSALVGSGANNNNKKYRSYRDHLRKVGASGEPGSGGLVSSQDLVDGYFAAAAAAAAAQGEPFFHPHHHQATALPNLYNQSLAAREQARSLLQASEHMRSLNNLSSSHHHNNNKQPMNSALQQQQQLARFSGQLGSHLNLPLSFAFGPPAATTANRATADQSTANARLLEGQLMTASAIWPPHLAQFSATSRNQQQQGLDNEHYQLVNCSSISPSSSSSMGAGSQSSGPQNNNKQTPRDSSSLNHYSTIDNNEDDDGCYEELEGSKAPPVKRSSSHLRQSSLTQATRTSTFVAAALSGAAGEAPDAKQQQNQKSSLRPSSNSSSSGCGDSGNTTSSSLLSEPFNRFGSKRNSHQQPATSKPIAFDKRLNHQDQLSPYAVSSICSNVPNQPPPPPMNSEAMRALNEQFDINQIMLLDTGEQALKQILPFEAPPPPEPHRDQEDDECRSQQAKRKSNKPDLT